MIQFPSIEDTRPFCYDHSGLFLKFISFIVLSSTLFGSIYFTAINFSSSNEILSFSGHQNMTKQNESFLILTVPRIDHNQVFSVFFLDVSPRSSDQNQLSLKKDIEITTDVNCQKLKNTNAINFQTNSIGAFGSYRFFSTDYYHYDFITARAWVKNSDNSSSNVHMSVRVIQSIPEFGKIQIKLRYYFSYCSFACFVVYFLSLIVFSGNDTRFEQIIVLVALLFCIFANYPFSFTPSTENLFVFHSFDNLLRGAYPAFNLVALYCIIYYTNSVSGGNVSIVLAISSLFVIAEAMSEFTDDSCVIANLFYGNSVVWLFFLSASVVTKFCLASVLLYTVFSTAFCSSSSLTSSLSSLSATTMPTMTMNQTRSKRKCGIFIVYSCLAFLEIAGMAAQMIVFAKQNCGNNAMDFFVQYMLQTTITLALACVHWPVKCPPVNGGGETLVSNPLDDSVMMSEELHLDVDALSAEMSAEIKSDKSDDDM